MSNSDEIKQLCLNYHSEKGMTTKEQKEFSEKLLVLLQDQFDEFCKGLGLDHFEGEEFMRLSYAIPDARARVNNGRKFLADNASMEFDTEKCDRYEKAMKTFQRVQYQLHLDEAMLERLLARMEKFAGTAF